ncbi:hypothetical protein GCM10011575_17280 [Microlunatus endophyticus]|uniref:Glycosyltransferase, GT2 family n=1 Tax=Microlunatus endophyticus TaxID=1716077 RepID=A0A917S5D0_9ACTN|nr:glycosyltransferase [Microlunatus endophyticus]GGL59276.1 hypothetical protein GCM10011575_17280 [Microlunatus endophyticus]
MQEPFARPIAVVVVNYASIGLIETNFAALSGAPDCRVVVVDNFTTADEQQRVREVCVRHGWEPVLSPTNEGFGLGVNAGVRRGRELGADAFLLINPDAIVDVATLTALHEHAVSQPDALVAPRVIRPDGTAWAAGSAVDLRTGHIRGRAGLRDLGPYEIGWLTGACLALSRELMDRVGGMADGYFLYWEDVDFSRRIQELGGTLVVREDLTVTHDEGGTQRDGNDRRLSDLYYFYNCRNRLVFASQNLARRLVLRWIATTPRESWQILLRGGRRQLLHTRSPLRAAVAGSLAGLRIALRGLVRPQRPTARTAATEAETSDSWPITALMSFPATPPKGNPYRLLLEQGLRTAPGLTIKHFSWRTALLDDYDVFHVHWPEILLEGTTPLKTAVRRLLFVLFMIRMRLRRVPIVRTMHNLELPQGIDPIEVGLLHVMERRTALWIRLNTSTDLPANRPGATILHGHYRDWYGRYPTQPTVRGRVVFQGLVRRYKNVPALVEAFRDVADPEASLHVLGKPSTAELDAQIRSAAGDDHRIDLQLGFVEESDLVAEITAAELVVLPYQEMHNSAAVLTALSLDRPVLVPDNEVNRKLAAEVGPGWVHTYAGEISAAAIEEALASVRAGHHAERPDLEARDWDLGGIQHANAYRRAVRSVGPIRSARSGPDQEAQPHDATAADTRSSQATAL